LNSATPTKIWDGSQTMSVARSNTLMISMGDKVGVTQK